MDSKERSMQIRTPRRILFIPHMPYQGTVKLRTVEMAKSLASTGKYEIFVLNWEREVIKGGLVNKITRRVLEVFRSLSTTKSVEEKDGVSWVRVPYLLVPFPVCQLYNKWQIEKLIHSERIDCVINANGAHFPMPKVKCCSYYYDLVDDHLSKEAEPISKGYRWRKNKEFIVKEVKKAKAVFIVSGALKKVVDKEGYHSKTILLNNGVNYYDYRTKDDNKINDIRVRYGLSSNFIISYIGNIGPWAEFDFAVEAFKNFNTKCPKSKLLVVGEIDSMEKYGKYFYDNAIIFTGPVAPAEVKEYFQVSDLGIMTSELSAFRNRAFPLKVLEYGAAAKVVLTTQLEELRSVNLPHVVLLDLDKNIWAREMEERYHNGKRWDPEWDAVIKSYDWGALLKVVEEQIDNDVR